VKRDRAATILGRNGGLKGGIARAARMTPEQRSTSARNAVRARWAKKNGNPLQPRAIVTLPATSSDHGLTELLSRLRVATDVAEIRLLAEQIERAVFRKQSGNI